MSVQITLTYPNEAAAARALQRLMAVDPADNPAAGAPEKPLALQQPAAAPPAPPEAPPVVNPVALFGGAAAPIPPQQDAYLAGITNRAPSTAAAVPLPTAPVASTGTAVPQPPAASLPAPPAPAAAAPTAPAAPTTPAGVERDSTGLPWDARIHAGNKARNKDGSWRAKKGLNDSALVSRIEAELRAAVAAPAAPAAPVVPPAPPVPAAPPVVPATPVAPVVPAAPPAAAPTDFSSFMTQAAPLYAADPVGTATKMGQALAPVGLSAIGQLAARPDLLPQVAAAFWALAGAPAGVAA